MHSPAHADKSAAAAEFAARASNSRESQRRPAFFRLVLSHAYVRARESAFQFSPVNNNIRERARVRVLLFNFVTLLLQQQRSCVVVGAVTR